MSVCNGIGGQLRDVGYAQLRDTETFSLFGFSRGDAWESFAASWNDLGMDLYMADGGRYRRRRHATFQVINGVARRLPHQAHFQSRDYNRLNGDVQRWFAPVAAAVEANVITQAIFQRCGSLFSELSGRQPHQR